MMEEWKEDRTKIKELLMRTYGARTTGGFSRHSRSKRKNLAEYWLFETNFRTGWSFTGILIPWIKNGSSIVIQSPILAQVDWTTANTKRPFRALKIVNKLRDNDLWDVWRDLSWNWDGLVASRSQEDAFKSVLQYQDSSSIQLNKRRNYPWRIIANIGAESQTTLILRLLRRGNVGWKG